MNRAAAMRLLAALTLAMGAGGVLSRAATASTPPHHAGSRQGVPTPLLVARGTSSRAIETFHAPGQWRITYTFSHCLSPSFVIYVLGGFNDVLSIDTLSGQGTQYEHAGGTISLQVSTNCTWRIDVLAGGKTVNGVGFSLSGNGIMNTMNLRVPSRWRLSYRFSDCSLIPNFAVVIHDGRSVTAVSKLGIKGAGSRVLHTGGIVYLNTNNTCAWHIAISR